MPSMASLQSILGNRAPTAVGVSSHDFGISTLRANSSTTTHWSRAIGAGPDLPYPSQRVLHEIVTIH